MKKFSFYGSGIFVNVEELEKGKNWVDNTKEIKHQMERKLQK